MELQEALDRLGERALRGGKLRCPEHADKVPSLHLYFKTNSWYCFSCGRTGDAYGLIALFTGQPIKDVLEQFAPRTDDHQRPRVAKRRNPYQVRRSLYQRVRVLNHQFFDSLRHILENKDLDMVVSHITYWSDRFQEIRAEVFNENIPPSEAERIVEDFAAILDQALEDLRVIAVWKGPHTS